MVPLLIIRTANCDTTLTLFQCSIGNMKVIEFRANRGFTLVEIMIVVAIIGLLASIAIPSFTKAKSKAQLSACVRNLQQIDGAKTQWALEKKRTAGAPIVESEVNDYLR